MGPRVADKLIARSVPENVRNAAVAPSIENVLLIWPYHGCGTADSGRRVNSCPLIAEKLISRRMPENMMNAVGPPIENVLLFLHQWERIVVTEIRCLGGREIQL